MRVIIIPADKFVSIDGVIKNIDFDIDENITAVQWHGQSGIVEQKSGGARFILNLDEFQEIIDLFLQPEPEPPAPTLEEARALKLSNLAALRYQKETGGMIFSGLTISTDDRSKTLLMGARIEAVEQLNLGNEFSISWKAGGGFVQVDGITIIAISNAVRSFVQNCFDAEREHIEAIENLTSVLDVQNYDFTGGWPE